MHALGYEVSTVTYDAVPKLKRLAKRAKIIFPMLSDENSEIIRAFGLLAENYPQGSFYYGIPHPAIIVVNADGKVSHRFSERKRHVCCPFAPCGATSGLRCSAAQE